MGRIALVDDHSTTARAFALAETDAIPAPPDDPPGAVSFFLGSPAPLIIDIYRAIGDPAGWDRLVAGLRTAFACDVATLILRRRDRTGAEILASAGPASPVLEDDWLSEFAAPAGLPPARWTALSGTRQGLLGLVACTAGLDAAITLLRAASSPPFSEPDGAVLDALLPDLALSIRLAAPASVPAATAVDPWRALVDHLDLPVLHVAPDLTLLDATPTGRAALDRGTPFRLAFGRLACAAPLATETLRRALASPDPPPELPLPTPSGPLICLRLVRADGDFLLVLPAPPAPVRVYAAAWSLTPAEARVAELACEGLSVDEIAARLGRGRETVRTQLKRCYAKTGAGGHFQLFALMHGHAQDVFTHPGGDAFGSRRSPGR